MDGVCEHRRSCRCARLTNRYSYSVQVCTLVLSVLNGMCVRVDVRVVHACACMHARTCGGGEAAGHAPRLGVPPPPQHAPGHRATLLTAVHLCVFVCTARRAVSMLVQAWWCVESCARRARASSVRTSAHSALRALSGMTHSSSPSSALASQRMLCGFPLCQGLCVLNILVFALLCSVASFLPSMLDMTSPVRVRAVFPATPASRAAGESSGASGSSVRGVETRVVVPPVRSSAAAKPLAPSQLAASVNSPSPRTSPTSAPTSPQTVAAREEAGTGIASAGVWESRLSSLMSIPAGTRWFCNLRYEPSKECKEGASAVFENFAWVGGRLVLFNVPGGAAGLPKQWNRMMHFINNQMPGTDLRVVAVDAALPLSMCSSMETRTVYTLSLWHPDNNHHLNNDNILPMVWGMAQEEAAGRGAEARVLYHFEGDRTRNANQVAATDMLWRLFGGNVTRMEPYMDIRGPGSDDELRSQVAGAVAASPPAALPAPLQMACFKRMRWGLGLKPWYEHHINATVPLWEGIFQRYRSFALDFAGLPQSIAAARAPNASTPLRVLYMRRRDGRELADPDALLRAFTQTQLAGVPIEVHMLTNYADVAGTISAVANADIVLSVHGAAGGGNGVFMRDGALLVEFAAAGRDYQPWCHIYPLLAARMHLRFARITLSRFTSLLPASLSPEHVSSIVDRVLRAYTTSPVMMQYAFDAGCDQAACVCPPDAE
ncbi:glycosyltransferase family 61 protein [archaeon]|nr:MAG: glycosyltransferase family 61 protein [archaeon]